MTTTTMMIPDPIAHLIAQSRSSVGTKQSDSNKIDPNLCVKQSSKLNQNQLPIKSSSVPTKAQNNSNKNAANKLQNSSSKKYSSCPRKSISEISSTGNTSKDPIHKIDALSVKIDSQADIHKTQSNGDSSLLAACNPFLNMNIPLINAASILSQQQCTTVPKSQIPFNPLMIPSFGPNIAPSIFAQSASPPSFEMPPVPKTLEELLEFQWMHTAHILVSQDDRKSVSFLLQKLHGLMNEKQKLVKEVKDLHQKVDLFDSTLKMVKEIVAVSKQVSEDDSELLMLTEKVNSKNNEEFDENKSINTSVQPRINSSTSQTPPNNQQISSTIKSGSSTPVNSLMNSSNSSTNAFNTSLNNILAATSRLRSSMTENNVTSDLNGISQSSRRSSLNSAPEITGTGSVTQANTDQSLILNNNSPNSPQTLNQSISSTPSLSNSLSNVATNNNIINPVVQDQYLRYLSKQLNSTSNVSPHNLPPTSGFNPNLYNSRNNGTTSNNSNNVNNLGPSLPFGGFDHPSQTHHLESTGHIKSHVAICELTSQQQQFACGFKWLYI
ncbi:hypothetical protein QR98_0023680 [Sarcoptes scabiei]|uniref:Uncharacterized protein n=1 Tax=Sarcoptes scabiei TaxID=52283 RepID=A0A131ZZJ8_SARSC|nr:hypothetical protein QR98_0023680 [Sarcoptes scabiei]